MSDELITTRQGPALHVLFNRPAQRNALTWTMYDGLVEACERADADEQVRVLVLRGAGDEAFVAGTDIGQFSEFSSGEDGIAYERRVERVLDRLETTRVPTVAAISGYCVGGGLAVAAVCDLRVSTPTGRFGVPVARTLGNCLAMNTYSLLVHHLGPARALDVLLRARMLTAEQAHAAGFVAELTDDRDATVEAVVGLLAQHAPLTMWAAKQAARRLRLANLPDGDDLVRAVFGSEDFRHGVRSFLDKEKPRWTGR
ncbi:enoyl-CoA hydratase/isomerase family protein [Saccharopolyspora erythraea]|uniref:enoyl-CoA hydratase/isomerase family protein n=1 Tax=Saccharopolyspora erythraea TaxID=1836 RepID=UPI00038D32A3|nr:enoyl-CoA hydratase/isomerase family protein [Saccharopolyspora erythraea]EQD85483.1 enoyl-CoA hydratase [Saccharopolyspora erythraea D]QRK86974.1 enoyl-CoA hydratase/isomerase family protein [Saccharopolyspora erythraea]